ncbi:MAG: type IV pilus modification PilV family protein [Gemmatimonadota bacterium]
MISALEGSTARGGFTLVETLVAMIVFSVGVLSLAQITGRLAVEMRRAGAQTAVVATAQTGMETREVQDFASVAVGTTVDTITIRGRAFVRTVTVTSPALRVKRVDVSVAPAVPPGPTHTLTSYVHKQW